MVIFWVAPGLIVKLDGATVIHAGAFTV